MTANEIIPNLFLGDLQDAYAFEGVRLCVAEELNPTPYLERDDDHQVQVHFYAHRGFEEIEFVRPEALTRAADLVYEALTNDRTVLVHYAAGIERSPLTIAWYLVRYGHFKSLDDAYRHVMVKRPIVGDRQYWLPGYPNHDGPEVLSSANNK